MPYIENLHIADEDSPYLKKDIDPNSTGYWFKYVMCVWYRYDDETNIFEFALSWRGSESKRDFVYNAKTILENFDSFSLLIKFSGNTKSWIIQTFKASFFIATKSRLSRLSA